MTNYWRVANDWISERIDTSARRSARARFMYGTARRQGYGRRWSWRFARQHRDYAGDWRPR